MGRICFDTVRSAFELAVFQIFDSIIWLLSSFERIHFPLCVYYSRTRWIRHPIHRFAKSRINIKYDFINPTLILLLQGKENGQWNAEIKKVELVSVCICYLHLLSKT